MDIMLSLVGEQVPSTYSCMDRAAGGVGGEVGECHGGWRGCGPGCNQGSREDPAWTLRSLALSHRRHGTMALTSGVGCLSATELYPPPQSLQCPAGPAWPSPAREVRCGRSGCADKPHLGALSQLLSSAGGATHGAHSGSALSA